MLGGSSSFAVCYALPFLSSNNDDWVAVSRPSNDSADLEILVIRLTARSDPRRRRQKCFRNSFTPGSLSQDPSSNTGHNPLKWFFRERTEWTDMCDFLRCRNKLGSRAISLFISTSKRTCQGRSFGQNEIGGTSTANFRKWGLLNRQLNFSLTSALKPPMRPHAGAQKHLAARLIHATPSS